MAETPKGRQLITREQRNRNKWTGSFVPAFNDDKLFKSIDKPKGRFFWLPLAKYLKHPILPQTKRTVPLIYAPRTVNTFIETTNLAGKTVIPFATSGGSSIGNSVAVLKQSYPNIKWQSGKLLNRVNEKEIEAWVTTFMK